MDSEIEYPTTLPLTINSYRIISLRIANTHKTTAVHYRYQRSWDLAKQAGIWIRDAGIWPDKLGFGSEKLGFSQPSWDLGQKSWDLANQAGIWVREAGI